MSKKIINRLIELLGQPEPNTPNADLQYWVIGQTYEDESEWMDEEDRNYYQVAILATQDNGVYVTVDCEEEFRSENADEMILHAMKISDKNLKDPFLFTNHAS